MEMQVDYVVVYAVMLGGDDRSSGTPGEWYSTESAANIAAKNRGWYGGDAPVKSFPAVRINGKAYILRSANPVDLDLEEAKQNERVKQQALGKLSPEERKVLGVN